MISTRKDLDELEGTQEHADFMALLQGSIYRADFDEAAQKWNAVKDTSLISQFGFKLSDFPNAKAPDISNLLFKKVEASELEAECDRRLALGFNYDFTKTKVTCSFTIAIDFIVENSIRYL